MTVIPQAISKFLLNVQIISKYAPTIKNSLRLVAEELANSCRLSDNHVQAYKYEESLNIPQTSSLRDKIKMAFVTHPQQKIAEKKHILKKIICSRVKQVVINKIERMGI